MKYTSTDDPNVLMDFYLPPDTSQTEKRPAVIFIHGGVKTQYTPKDWGLDTTWGRLIAASGFNDLLGFWMRGVAEDTQPFFNASTDTPQPRPTTGSLTPSNC